MKNADIIKKITDYIQSVATERGLTHRDIANLCSQKGANVAQTTITKMFNKPSSMTISTLLKVCDGLDLNPHILPVHHTKFGGKAYSRDSSSR